MTETMTRPAGVWSIGAPRLLAGALDGRRLDARGHLSVHGPPVGRTRETLTSWCSTVGLRGRGGAAFPAAAKLAALPREGAAAVVVNACEGEPGSAKDRALLNLVPHLVLDGAVTLAAAVGAEAVVVVTHNAAAARSIQAAAAERRDRLAVTVDHAPGGFVAGEGRAVLAGLSGGPAVPPGRRWHATAAGLHGRPTFASNAETFAQLGLLARMGPQPFAATGLAHEAGTMLLTVGGALARPGVVEVPIGTPTDVVLHAAEAPTPAAVVLGGYHGTWVDPASARSLAVTAGTPVGAGVLLALDSRTCLLGELARVTSWLASESAGQCGPCVFGMPALADSLAGLWAGRADAWDRAQRRIALLPGRGACAHPDGAARFVASGLSQLANEIAVHRRGGCGRPLLGQLPLPGGDCDEAGDRLDPL
jgi:NADH:ubiquinone oxidoreductase subunit F (NADH-binding)